MGKGDCRLQGLLHSDDTQVMIQALQTLGRTQFHYEENGSVVIVKGTQGQFYIPEEEIYLGNAGTA